ncbi:MAG: DUF559 domain-containing protein [Flavobacteriales bacterium]|nr:DUF559 domain-containing protein [Flavobacteriales bacterium]
MPKSNSHYNKQLKEFARNLRNHSTKAEIILWKHILRASGTGVAFRRQRPIDRYIADFICIELGSADFLFHSLHPTVIQHLMLKR